MSHGPSLDARWCLCGQPAHEVAAIVSPKRVSEGELAKDAGIERISGRPDLAPWRAEAWRVLERLAASGEEFTSEAITRVVGQPGHPNAVGALFSHAARSGIVVRVGFDKAERTNQHAALISVWRGKRP